MGISEEPPHSIVHWCGMSILPTPLFILATTTAPTALGGPILGAALFMRNISKRAQVVSHLLDGMLNSLETHSPFPVGAGADIALLLLLFCTLCVSLPNSCPCLVSRGQISKSDAWNMRCPSLSALWQTHPGFTMIIWGVPLFKVRGRKSNPCAPPEVSGNAILPQATMPSYHSENSRLLM